MRATVMARKFRTEGNLVGLLYKHPNFYGEGDPDKKPILAVRPIGLPMAILDIPLETPYRKQIRLFEARAPPIANAYALGGEAIPGEESDETYDIVIQYHRIREGDWRHVAKFEKEDWLLAGFAS